MEADPGASEYGKGTGVWATIEARGPEAIQGP